MARREAACPPGPGRRRGVRPCRRPGRGTPGNRWSSVLPFVRRGWSPVWHRVPAPTLRRDLPGGRPCPYQRSLDATGSGDTTPRIMRSTGGVSHAGPGDHDSLIRSYEKGNGVITRSVSGRSRMLWRFIAQTQSSHQSDAQAPPSLGLVALTTRASGPFGERASRTAIGPRASCPACPWVYPTSVAPCLEVMTAALTTCYYCSSSPEYFT
jgi:hypothetical protein